MPQHNHMLYSTPEGPRPRSTTTFRDYTLFMDIGSFRSTIMCWPDAQDVGRFPDHIVKFVIPWRNDEGNERGRAFPSAFLLAADERIQLVEDPAILEKAGIVSSVKQLFAENYSLRGGEVGELIAYVKELLSRVALEITSANRSLWDHRELPRIREIRVTLPDLFIENLREGFCKNIELALQKLIGQTPEYQQIFGDAEAGASGVAAVRISTDEGGAGEVFFIHLLESLSFLDLSNRLDREHDVEHVRKFFGNRPVMPAKAQFYVCCCRLDIGGLTTDASASMLRCTKNPKTGHLYTELVQKESVSQPQAGQWLQGQFEGWLAGRPQPAKGQPADQDGHWWDNREFLRDEAAHFVRGIMQNQWETVRSWLSNPDWDLEGVYYVVSGRPTGSVPMQRLIRQIVMEVFNQERLVMLPEHCLCMAEFPLLWRDNRGKTDVDDVPEFAKLVTVVGNMLARWKGGDCTVDPKVREFQVRVVSSARGVPTFAVQAGEVASLKDYALFTERLRDKPYVSLEFSPKSDGHFTEFLRVRGAVSQSPEVKLSIGPREYLDRVRGAWIIQSLWVEGLDKESATGNLELVWSHPEGPPG